MGQKILGVMYEGKSYLVEYTSDTEFTMTDQNQKVVASKEIQKKNKREMDRIVKVKKDFDVEQKKRNEDRVDPKKSVKLKYSRLSWKQAIAAGAALAAISSALYYFF